MSKYKVLVNGENFLLDYEGRPKKLGFYVWRSVEASDAEAAENAVIELIRGDTRLKGKALNGRDDPPMLYAEEVVEVDERESDEGLDTGFSWYDEGTE